MDIGNEIIKDFVVSISNRIFRKAFGSPPEFIQDFHTGYAGYADFTITWYVKALDVISVRFICLFKFPKLTIQVWADPAELSDNHRINFGDPNSKDQITRFFTEKVKTIKKKSKDKKFIRKLIDRKLREY